MIFKVQFQPYDSTIPTLSDEAHNSAMSAARSSLAPKPALRKKIIYLYHLAQWDPEPRPNFRQYCTVNVTD